MPLARRALFLLLAAPGFAQTGSVPGVDLRIYDVGTPFVWARRGPAWPNGEVSVGIGHSMCNAGSVHLPWLGWVGGTQSGVMLDTYPKIAYLIVRESGGRLEQIGDGDHLKHSRFAFNIPTGACGTCQTGPAQTFRIGCGDVYSAGFNSNQNDLGPTREIDPWLGSWQPVGSYFDRGDPAVSGPAATDGIQSLGTTGWDAFKNRMLLREADLLVPGAVYYGQSHVVAKTEPGDNRGNNLGSRPMTFGWDGTAWTGALGTGAFVAGSVLNRWTGAAVSQARNGLDDGHFVVAVKVTGPVDGMWHYEYAVHNQDNTRGGASFRIQLCPTARVANAGFRDIDGDALNDWAISQTAGELAFLATATNPLDWNTIYNVWFDCDAAPAAGTLTIDQARLGPGALSVAVATQVPGLLLNEHLGAGCGTPVPALFANGSPTAPNPAYALQARVGPGNLVVFAFAAQPANVPLGGGCTLFVDSSTLIATHLVQASASGVAAYALPVPAGLALTGFAAQAFEVVPGSGAVAGLLHATNGLHVRAAGTGCP